MITRWSHDVKNYLFMLVFECWRRGWDSNPRYGFPHARFRGECFQPLSHVSAVVVGVIVAERCVFRQSSARFARQEGAGGPRAATQTEFQKLKDSQVSGVQRRRIAGWRRSPRRGHRK